jgi:phosphatidylinositol alpha-mannosyltransferase
VRIAQVCPYDIDRPGGVQRHIRDVAAALAARGHQVTIIAPKANTSLPDSEVQNGVRLCRVGGAFRVRIGGTGYELSAATGGRRRALERLVNESDFDVVHYHTMWVPFVPVQVFRAARKPSVATFHDTTAPSFSGRIMRACFRAFSRRMLPRLGEVIAVSPGPVASFGARPPSRPIHLIPPCTDLVRFANTGAARTDAAGPVRLLFLGRLEPRKGAMLLLKAYERLRAENLDVALTIAGEGPEKPALSSYVRARGLEGVAFHGAFADAETPALYAACDIFCAPSPYGESFGIVIAEAMAAGRPVVAAANMGYAQLLTGEAAPFLVPPFDVEALAAALTRLVRDPSLRAKLGAWGRENSAQYDCNRVVHRLVTLYERAIVTKKPILDR